MDSEDETVKPYVAVLGAPRDETGAPELVVKFGVTDGSVVGIECDELVDYSDVMRPDADTTQLGLLLQQRRDSEEIDPSSVVRQGEHSSNR